MEKKYYIQPKMEVGLLHMESIMIPTSPGVSGNYDPGMPGGAPKHRTPVF